MRFHFCKYLHRVILALCAALLLVSAPGRAAGVRDKGDFKPSYGPAKDATSVKWKAYLQKKGFLEGMARWLNTQIALPFDIGLSTGECGEANSFYSPKTHKVTLCYELVDQLEELFKEPYPDQDERNFVAANALSFVAYHEIGHALIDALDLPITGKEEDAADQLAVYLLCEKTEDMKKLQVFCGAFAFYLIADQQEDKLEKLRMWSVHSLSQQRFYTILALLYGSDPKIFARVREILPADRRAQAGEEWSRARKSWSVILGPHMKK